MARTLEWLCAPSRLGLAAIGVGGLLASALTIAVARAPAPAAAQAKRSGPSVLIHTTSVKEGSLPRIVRAYGTVQANSSARESIMAPVASTVATVYVRVGEEIAKGAPLLRLVPTPQTASSYAQAVSASRVARDLVERTKELFGEHLATRQQLSSAKKVESDARASLDALKAQGAAGPSTLRAPFRGIVTVISTTAHAITAEGTALLELVRPNALILNVGIVPSEALTVEHGDPASVTAIGGTQVFPAKVMMRGSVVNASTGLVPVQLSVPVGALLPGQWAQAAITVGKVHGYVVPHEAILVDNQGETYVVQAQGGVAKIVYVHILASLGTRDTVAGSLDVKAPLVLAGSYQLQNGMRVRLQDPPSHARR
ncbi:MAG: efflux RND transporter periplasmic adaptor subunit [Steroidobacteraceae bacterium]